jgi:hypothetical protein
MRNTAIAAGMKRMKELILDKAIYPINGNGYIQSHDGKTGGGQFRGGEWGFGYQLNALQQCYGRPGDGMNLFLSF